MESAKRGMGWLIVIATLVVVAAACGGRDTAGDQRAVTVSDLQQKQYFYQGQYLGRVVTVSAAVSGVSGPRVFTLSGGDSGEETLVVTAQPAGVAMGQLVRVTGTVGQLHRSAPSQGAPYLQADLYPKYETQAYLYAATVQPQRRLSRASVGR